MSDQKTEAAAGSGYAGPACSAYYKLTALRLRLLEIGSDVWGIAHPDGCMGGPMDMMQIRLESVHRALCVAHASLNEAISEATPNKSGQCSEATPA